MLHAQRLFGFKFIILIRSCASRNLYSTCIWYGQI